MPCGYQKTDRWFSVSSVIVVSQAAVEPDFFATSLPLPGFFLLAAQQESAQSRH
jgi:hypothetical protein